MAKRSMLVEESLRKETLQGIKTSEDRGHAIWAHTLCVIEDNKIIAREEAAGNKNPKMVARYKEIIANLKSSIKDNMTKLGADEAYVSEMMTLIDNGDSDGAQVHLLKLLVQRNPGMYSRKLVASQSKVAQK